MPGNPAIETFSGHLNVPIRKSRMRYQDNKFQAASKGWSITIRAQHKREDDRARIDVDDPSCLIDK